MLSFMRLVSATLVATTGYAMITPRDDATGTCENGAIVITSTVNVNGNQVEVATVSCGANSVAAFQNARAGPYDILPYPTDTTSTSSAPAPAPTPVNVCNAICSTECDDIGNLPPISDDCAVIVDAIQILNGSIAPTFTVNANHVQQLTFGTCRFFFENTSPGPLTYCWTALSNAGSAAATACFPPVQPVNSAGFCRSSDGFWEVGVAHS